MYGGGGGISPQRDEISIKVVGSRGGIGGEHRAGPLDSDPSLAEPASPA